MKHTPGPWRWERGRLMAGPSIDDAGYPMPEIVQESNYGTTEADKALIAEAPAMLEALRQMRYRLIDAIEDSGYSVAGPTVWGAEDGYPKWVASARAEIAEAQAIINRIEG